MLNRKKLMISVIATLVPAYAFADATPSAAPAAAPQVQAVVNQAPQPATPQQVQAVEPSEASIRIKAINERIAVLQAELNELDVKAQIAERQAAINHANQPAQALSLPQNSGVLSRTQNDDFTPTVSEISGIDGNLKAVMYVQNNSQQTVRLGDVISGWRVSEIKMDSVTLSKGKTKKYLGFGSYTQQNASYGGYNGGSYSGVTQSTGVVNTLPAPVMPAIPPMPSFSK